LLSAAEARALEPELACTAALLSPSTGIIDSHGLMLALLGDAEREGASLALRCPLQRGSIEPAGFILESGGAESLRFRTAMLINAAGLWAPEVAARSPAFRLTGYRQAITPRATTTRSPAARLSRGWSIHCRKPAAWAST
jgi:L-2-hydroxyglutarate oxidase LhgO